MDKEMNIILSNTEEYKLEDSTLEIYSKGAGTPIHRMSTVTYASDLANLPYQVDMLAWL
jgi:hypothetical protein